MDHKRHVKQLQSGDNDVYSIDATSYCSRIQGLVIRGKKIVAEIATDASETTRCLFSGTQASPCVKLGVVS